MQAIEAIFIKVRQWVLQGVFPTTLPAHMNGIHEVRGSTPLISTTKPLRIKVLGGFHLLIRGLS